MPISRQIAAGEALESFRLQGNVYVLGCFEKGLTIYSQQIRALNLAWSMVKSAPVESLRRVAVVGGGFAGLSVAAGLLKKGVRHVALFEKHAVLCPLQQGSDARWVHPRIYEWPDKGSSLPTAALPLLNWNAGRASDVVVQVLKEWESLKKGLPQEQKIEEYVNVRHLRVSSKMEIEWVGQKTAVKSDFGTSGTRETFAPLGTKETFDSVILAVGFGMEKDVAIHYWRNETFGQPQLMPGTQMYLVSGHGDGALVDLFRIRISRFRQDRILVELFPESGEVVKRLQHLKTELDRGSLKREDLYDRFEKLTEDLATDFKSLLAELQSRLRADTDAVLRLNKIDSFRKVFATRASFQNQFLLFALYKAGGFYPSSKDETTIRSEYGISDDHVIHRHGIEPEVVIQSVLDKDFYCSVEKEVNSWSGADRQPRDICWTGGYWNTQAEELTGKPVADSTKQAWRQEYLPPATEVLATGFVAAVAGYLQAEGTCGDDFRTTLHRTLRIGQEITLQQLTPYLGQTSRYGEKGRTFGFSHGTIGYAASTRMIVRTREKTGAESEDDYRAKFWGDMEKVALNEHSQKMNGNVRSVVAIPILEQERKYTIAVLFADSTSLYAFNDTVIQTLSRMCQFFASRIGAMHSDRVRSFNAESEAVPTSGHYAGHLDVLESLSFPLAPVADRGVNYLNVEFTDFVSAMRD